MMLFHLNQQYIITFHSDSCMLEATLDKRCAELPQCVRWAEAEPGPMMISSRWQNLDCHCPRTGLELEFRSQGYQEIVGRGGFHSTVLARGIAPADWPERRGHSLGVSTPRRSNTKSVWACGTHRPTRKGCRRDFFVRPTERMRVAELFISGWFTDCRGNWYAEPVAHHFHGTAQAENKMWTGIELQKPWVAGRAFRARGGEGWLNRGAWLWCSAVRVFACVSVSVSLYVCENVCML